MTVADYVTLIVGLGIAALGLFLVLVGVQYYLEGRQVMGEETAPVEDLGPGPASVSGVSRPAEEGVLTAPFTDRDCVALKYEVREAQGKNRQTPTLVAEGNESVPFYVDDGPGEVLVRPDAADLEMETEGEITVAREEQPPEPIKRFLSRREDIGEPPEPTIDIPGSGIGTRYFCEQLLESGEEVYVYGQVTERQSEEFGETDLEIREGAAGGRLTPPTTFIVSDQPKEAVVGGQKWGGILFFVIGASRSPSGERSFWPRRSCDAPSSVYRARRIVSISGPNGVDPFSKRPSPLLTGGVRRSAAVFVEVRFRGSSDVFG